MILVVVFTGLLMMRLLTPAPEAWGFIPAVQNSSDWRRLPSGIWVKVHVGESGVPVTAHIQTDASSVIFYTLQPCPNSSKTQSILWVLELESSIHLDCDGKERLTKRPRALEESLKPFPKEIRDLIERKRLFPGPSIQI